jgi:hypothetical protein
LSAGLFEIISAAKLQKISDSRNSLYLFYENLCKINTSYGGCQLPKEKRSEPDGTVSDRGGQSAQRGECNPHAMRG